MPDGTGERMQAGYDKYVGKGDEELSGSSSQVLNSFKHFEARDILFYSLHNMLIDSCTKLINSKKFQNLSKPSINIKMRTVT